jgi:hypothetical protein
MFSHPTAALFHVVFKILAVLVYLFGGFFFSEAFIGIYVTLILLISMDFWTVKNVTGRLMVGLRWWNFIDDEGNSHWVFENKHLRQQQEQMTNGMNLMSKQSNSDATTTGDSGLFWAALIIQPIVWFFLLLVAVFRLNIQYFMIVSLALILSSSNMYGYIRCRVGSSDLKSAATQYIGKQIFFNFMSGNLGGGAANNAPKQGMGSGSSSLPNMYPSA